MPRFAARENNTGGRSLLQAVSGILFGIVALVAPIATALALVILLAAWSIVTGVLEVLVAIRLRKEIEGEWLLALAGVISILLGILLAARPDVGVRVITWMIGGYAIAVGIILVMLAFRLKRFVRPLGRAARM